MGGDRCGDRLRGEWELKAELCARKRFDVSA